MLRTPASVTAPGVALASSLLEDAPFEVLLVNARHVKNLPGRKTDVSDAAWLAQLGAHGWSAARSCHPSRSGSCGT